MTSVGKKSVSKHIIDGRKISLLFDFDVELIFDGLNTGEYNMHFDETRAYEVEQGKSLPMLRFYGWNPWTVSLGANQKESDFDPEKLQMYGFGLVRRPTGGRAVLHANESTYSFVCKLDSQLKPLDVYKEIHIFLVEGLKQLGAEGLSFEKSQPNFNEFYKRETASLSCFAGSARYEIEWQGKKLVGSAQRVLGNTLLQHGSILLGPGYELLAEVANLPDEKSRDYLRNYIKSHSISVEEITGKETNFFQAIETFSKLLL
ncbi:lipoate--protein ligase family protein [Bacteroidetes/Chlorobi group bacterium MS-B_bin-24]|nr:MAG: lipoate--protein ligase family protein [Bacteroidetes/Chlorobi group bacterium MS-B_bin-24]